MPSSASAKAGSGFSVAAYAKSAKESAKRVAEEKGITSRGKLWETMKAKAHSFSWQVQETVSSKRATSTRRGTGEKRSTVTQRAKSVGAHGANATDVDEELVAQICEHLCFVSPVAAKLALSKSRGTKHQKLQIACDWLLDEKNTEEVEAAENADVERKSQEDFEKMQKSASAKEVTKPQVSEQPSVSAGGSQAPRARRVQRDSVADSPDDGRGLGFFMRRRSFSSPQRRSQPSPQKVPMPGRLSRGRVSTGSADSGVGDDRPSLARRISAGSQTSGRSGACSPAMTPREKCTEPCSAQDARDDAAPATAECTEGVACSSSASRQPSSMAEVPESSNTPDACENAEADDLASESDISEEEQEEDEAAMFLRPPVGASCWDWPLSRYEKKARVQQLERQMNVMDQRSLKQEIHHLRKMSVGGASCQARRPSRLST